VNYGPNADGFDCCGLVATAYHMAGYSTPSYATSVPGLIAEMKSRGNWKDCNLSNYQSVLSPGDVIFCSTGHVAIYCGGSTMIHAPVPGSYVCYANVYACIGGGFGG
jgi:cell wall-associated NlpC family hydrolase